MRVLSANKKHRAMKHQRIAQGRLRQFWLCILGAGLLQVIAICPLGADIYRYIDSQGVMHFTNIPTSSDYKLYIRERPKRSLAANIPDTYDPVIAKAAERFGVSFSLLKALIKIESDFDPLAVSSVGAKGLMQIMPDNVEALNITNPFDPFENIMGGASYLKRLIKRFDGKLPLALAAYNAGPSVVEQYKGIPPFKETEDFVQNVMKYYSVIDKR